MTIKTSSALMLIFLVTGCSINSDIKQIKSEIRSLQRQIDSVEEKTDGLFRNQQVIHQDLKRLYSESEREFSTTRKRLTRLENKLKLHSQQLQSVKQKTDQFEVRRSSKTLLLIPSSFVSLAVNGQKFLGTINHPGDVNWYKFEALERGVYIIETWPGSLSDNYMHLFGPNTRNTEIAANDDGGTGNAAKIVKVLSPGTYYIKIRAYSSSGTGSYEIKVSTQ